MKEKEKYIQRVLIEREQTKRCTTCTRVKKRWMVVIAPCKNRDLVSGEKQLWPVFFSPSFCGGTGLDIQDGLKQFKREASASTSPASLAPLPAAQSAFILSYSLYLNTPSHHFELQAHSDSPRALRPDGSATCSTILHNSCVEGEGRGFCRSHLLKSVLLFQSSPNLSRAWSPGSKLHLCH